MVSILKMGVEGEKIWRTLYVKKWHYEKHPNGTIWLLESKSDHHTHFKQGLKEKPDDSDDGVKWEVASFNGSWVAGQTAGGCRNFIDSFASNPQFVISLEVNTFLKALS